MTPAMRAAAQWARVYGVVERRLEDGGAIEEIRHLHGMSQAELDLLVLMERGMGPSVPSFHTPTTTCEIPRVIHRFSTTNPQGCAPSTPQGGCAPVADMENYTDGIRSVA